jgi:nucleoside 2-deoxyribosyltransferase
MDMSTRPITKAEIQWMAGNLIYLATPFTLSPQGFEGAATTAANIAARLAKATDGAVFSPIAHAFSLSRASDSDPVKDEALWRPLNEYMMQEADILVVAHMDGWQDSVGIAEEIEVFIAAGKPIFDMPDISRVGSMHRRRPQKPVRDRIDGRPIEEVTADADQFLAQRHG